MPLRMDNMGIVVADLDAAVAFFTALGLTLEGRTTVEGPWAGRVTGLGAQRVEIAMLRTPDGHGALELSRFLAPKVVADHRQLVLVQIHYRNTKTLQMRQKRNPIQPNQLGRHA